MSAYQLKSYWTTSHSSRPRFLYLFQPNLALNQEETLIIIPWNYSNWTIVSRFRHNVAEHRKDSDAFVIPHTCVYSAEVHWATKLPLIRLLLTKLPSEPATIRFNNSTHISRQFSVVSTLATSAQGDTVKKTDEYESSKTQENYEANHDNLVRFKPVFAPRDSVFVARPPFSALPAKFLTAEGYKYILPRWKGQYRSISIGPEYVMIWQDGI